MVEIIDGSQLRPLQPTRSQSSDDDFEDETLGERLWGLTEMFPESIRSGTAKLSNLSVKGVKKLYKFTRSTIWIVGTSAVILALPVLFEIERVQTEEAQLMQQRQILLGPGSTQGMGGQIGQPLNLNVQRR